MSLDAYASLRVHSEHGSAQGRRSARKSEDSHRHRDRRRRTDLRPPPGRRSHRRSDREKKRTHDRKSTKDGKDVYKKLRPLLSPPRSSRHGHDKARKDRGHKDGRRDSDRKDHCDDSGKKSRPKNLLSPDAYSKDKKPSVSRVDLRENTRKDDRHHRGSNEHKTSSSRHHRMALAERRPLLSPEAYSRHGKTDRQRRSRSRHRRGEKRHKSRSEKKSASDRLSQTGGISGPSRSAFGGSGVWKEPSPTAQGPTLAAAPMQGTNLMPRVRPSVAPSVAPHVARDQLGANCGSAPRPSSASQWPDPEGGPRPPPGPPPPHVLRQHHATAAS